MPLTFEQVVDHYEAPRYRDQIQGAVRHEMKIRFHTETRIEENYRSIAVTEFLKMVEEILRNKAKYRLFMSLFKFPVETLKTTEVIFQALEKVFESRDSTFLFEFTSSSDHEDCLEFRASYDKFTDLLFRNFQTKFNSILLVDLPQEQTSEKPEPYAVFLDISRVIDLTFADHDKTKIESIIFEYDDDHLAVYDDFSYRIFRLDKNKIIPEPVVDNPHGLGYCPARFILDAPVNDESPIIKEHILTKYITDLNWLLYFTISKKNLDLYAAYPIFSSFESECDYANPTDGSYCDQGFLKNEDNLYLLDGEVLKRCPVCEQRKFAGFGSLVEVPPPGPENEFTDMRNPVSVTTIDRPSLDYNVAEVERLENVIFVNVTGASKDIVTDQAINDLQVTATFEDRTRAISRLARILEKSHQWFEATAYRLRYGSTFVSASINSGKEFYLYPTHVLNKLYDEAREKNRPLWQLDLLEDELIMTKYKHNSEIAQRLKIIKNIDPFRHRTISQLQGLLPLGLIPEDDFKIKFNLSSLLLKFERDNGISIVEFGSEASFKVKIDNIYKTLKNYVSETNQGGEQVDDDGSRPEQGFTQGSGSEN